MPDPWGDPLIPDEPIPHELAHVCGDCAHSITEHDLIDADGTEVVCHVPGCGCREYVEANR